MKNVVVVGSQWGDEGKGKIVDWLSEQSDVVIRFQGGHNAGHTIKVNGERTQPNMPFRFDDLRKAEDDYAKSKAEAEIGLLQIAKETQLEVVIIRSPLVYGPGVKANFEALLKLASKNLPLPFGSIKNKRGVVAIDNLASLIISCIDHPKAANQLFLVSDDNDISTS